MSISYFLLLNYKSPVQSSLFVCHSYSLLQYFLSFLKILLQSFLNQVSESPEIIIPSEFKKISLSLYRAKFTYYKNIIFKSFKP